MHSWRHWFEYSSKQELEMHEIAQAYYDRYGSSEPRRITEVRMRNDPDYRRAVSEQQYADGRATMFGLAVIIEMLEAQMQERRSP